MLKRLKLKLKRRRIINKVKEEVGYIHKDGVIDMDKSIELYADILILECMKENISIVGFYVNRNPLAKYAIKQYNEALDRAIDTENYEEAQIISSMIEELKNIK